MFERFTKPAREAVKLAAAEAERLEAPVVRTEHVLLGLIAAGDPVLTACGFTLPAARAAVSALSREAWQENRDAESLRGIGIDLEALRSDIAESFGPDAWSSARPDASGWRGRPARGVKRFSPGARKALELSLREAIRRKDRSIACEHIILGITRDPKDLSRPLLESRTTIHDLRARAEAELDRAA